MIRLEYRPDNFRLQRNKYNEFRASSKELVETTFFNMPVRFNVDGVELFEKATHDSTVFVCHVEQEMHEPDLNLELSSPWNPVPLLHIATVGLIKVRSACRGETAIYNLPNGGYLLFRSNGNSLEIFSSISQRSVLTTCTELLIAFEDFKESIRQVLIKEVPGLVEHPGWSSWFEEKINAS